MPKAALTRWRPDERRHAWRGGAVTPLQAESRLARLRTNALGPGLREWLAVTAILVVVLAAYADTARSMIDIWVRSDTFAHGFLVVPLFLWLVWRNREALDRIAPQPFLPALAGIAGAAAVWMIADRMSINSLAQAAMIAMVPLSTWTLLGTRFAAQLAMPFAFLFFAVPFGEFMIPQLISWTGDFTVRALQFSGVPVLREGNLLVVPNGRWAIVEACSGVRYLIASAMVGLLFAYISYRSAWRRFLFIVASLLVPIVANWLRAYMIVMLGYLTDNRLAAGIDHIIYGWIFFGVVMALLFGIGSRWREDDLPVAAAPGAARMMRGDSTKRWLSPRLRLAIAGAVALGVAAPVLARFAWVEGDDSATAALAAPAPRGSWTKAGSFTAWRPDLTGAAREVTAAYAQDGARVGLQLSLYGASTREAKAISAGNQLVRPTNEHALLVDQKPVALERDGAPARAEIAMVDTPGGRLAVLRWFWVDGRVALSELEAKWRELVAVLGGGEDRVAWVVTYTPVAGGEAAAIERLRAFHAAMAPAVDAALRRAVEGAN
jgi:exosortase A